ncbi:MAG: hypothetical protein ACK4S6_16230 [Roseateles asaccharophilus]|uniref:hypothetical protein n=1 Tax=Roseateles asaccharophilus TaxID=582607 RepID=UPI00391B8671
MTTEHAPETGAETGAIPPELQALAAAADSELQQAQLPGMAEALAEQTAAAHDEAARELGEIHAALCLAVKFGGFVEPALPRYFTPEALGEVASAYMECADKYGWTFHKHIATGPEVKLGFAIGVPAFMVFKERQARLEAEALAARQAQHQARQQGLRQVHPQPEGGPADGG